MRIISWNILSNEFIRKKDYPMINSKILFNRQQRLENIMRILINLNGDIILLHYLWWWIHFKIFTIYNISFIYHLQHVLNLFKQPVMAAFTFGWNKINLIDESINLSKLAF